MARHTKEWNEGYQAAIEAIKKAMQGGGSGDGDGEGLPSDMTPPPSGNGESGSGKSKQNKGQQDQQSNSGLNSRTNPNDESQGIVRPEDCSGQLSGIADMPSTPGGYFSKEDGDKLAEREGYGIEGGTDSAIERNWKDAALKSIKDMPLSDKKAGTAWGKLKAQLEGLYKTKTDWKKQFRDIIGSSLNEAEKRRAFSNKNILVSQGRHARTDKDAYDNMDYMVVCVDSSGSMSNDQLKLVLSEVYQIATDIKPIKLIVVQCDTRIQEIKEYTDVNQLKKDVIHATVKGRGGTELKPFWDLFKTNPKFNRSTPDLVMVFTDGYLRQYKRNPLRMNNFCWAILDNPGWTLENKDAATRVVHLSTSSIK